jgi:hypothetical protein
MLYIFVDIKIDPHHFLETIHLNFVKGIYHNFVVSVTQTKHYNTIPSRCGRQPPARAGQYDTVCGHPANGCGRFGG